MKHIGSKFNRRFSARRGMRRSVTERIDLVDTQFALQSLEDEGMFVAAEESEEVAEAEDDETGVPFTNSMDENIVMLFPTHEEAKQFVEDNELADKVKIVCVTVHPDEEAEAIIENFDGILNHDKLVEDNNDLRNKVLETLTLAKDVIQTKMITDVRQLSSPYSDSAEGQHRCDPCRRRDRGRCSPCPLKYAP